KVYSNKKIKNAIPFVTSYYKKNWGFCLSYNDKKKIEKNYTDIDKFKVKIDSSFNSNGKLHYGEVLLGNNKNKKEILISTYVCHPSMANNELSGPILSMSLINHFRNKKLNINIRFLFIPETIGSIAYISRNFKFLKKNIIGGYNLTCVGDEKTYSCIPSPSQKSASDIALFESYKELRIKFKKYDFLSTAGSDERQYNHPSVNLGITVVCRSKFSTFKEYHTSLDDFNLVTKKGIYESYLLVKRAIFFMQKQIYPKPTTVCEPKLDKHHLMKTVSTTGNRNIYLDFLRYADGKNSLDIIAKKTKFQLQKVKKIYYILKKKKIVY
ncbi:DUF4910 domain-containing protein, partial [Candidatus Pelagibacter sp.]|nr:DUF4910 domain-containing protein [Candidatus Pelagibacter sp.]